MGVSGDTGDNVSTLTRGPPPETVLLFVSTEVTSYMRAALGKGFEVFLTLGAEIDLDIRSRNCDRAIQWSPSFVSCDE